MSVSGIWLCTMSDKRCGGERVGLSKSRARTQPFRKGEREDFPSLQTRVNARGVGRDEDEQIILLPTQQGQGVRWKQRPFLRTWHFSSFRHFSGCPLGRGWLENSDAAQWPRGALLVWGCIASLGPGAGITGRGAESLQLAGVQQEVHFTPLFPQQSPDGERPLVLLTQRNFPSHDVILDEGTHVLCPAVPNNPEADGGAVPHAAGCSVGPGAALWEAFFGGGEGNGGPQAVEMKSPLLSGKLGEHVLLV